MKKIHCLVKLLAFAGGLALAAGCGPSAPTNTVSDAQLQEKIRVFEADMLARSQDLETRLEILQGHGLNLPDAAKDRWLESSEKYTQAQDIFRARLQSAHDQTQATWNAYQTEMLQHWEAVEAAFQELKKTAGSKLEAGSIPVNQ